MGSVNKVVLIGNLGRDAELRYTTGGQPVATLNVATTETWNDKEGQRQEKTEWHRCVLWGKVAESLQEYLVRGKQIYVEGRLQTRQWEDKSGQKKFTTEIRVDRVVLLGGGKGDGQGDGQRRQAREQDSERVADQSKHRDVEVEAAPREPVELSYDDIPFVWIVPILLPLAMVGRVLLGA